MAKDDLRRITVKDAHGREWACRILSVYVLDGKYYALIRRLEDPVDSAVIMQFTEADGASALSEIKSDREYERVMAHVKEEATHRRSQRSRPR